MTSCCVPRVPGRMYSTLCEPKKIESQPQLLSSAEEGKGKTDDRSPPEVAREGPVADGGDEEDDEGEVVMRPRSGRAVVADEGDGESGEGEERETRPQPLGPLAREGDVGRGLRSRGREG